MTRRTRTYARILTLLDDDPGITFRQLAAKVGVSVSTAFWHVQRLVEDGTVEWVKCPSCGRPILRVT